MDVETLTLTPLTLALAVGAGLLSFVSPCVLPLLPAYLGYMTGLSVDELTASQTASTRLHILGRSVAFVFGLSAVFMLLGATASAVGQVFLHYQTLFVRIAGVAVVLLGLHMLGLIRIPWLYREKRASFGQSQRSLVGAFLMGTAFAAGWTPCIGPFLAGLLGLASQEQTVGQGMLLLFAYGLGLGVPFVLAGLALRSSLRLLQGAKRNMLILERTSGLLLVGMGLLIFSDRLALLSIWLTSVFGTGLAA